jgi:hypothetical protein
MGRSNVAVVEAEEAALVLAVAGLALLLRKVVLDVEEGPDLEEAASRENLESPKRIGLKWRRRSSPAKRSPRSSLAQRHIRPEMGLTCIPIVSPLVTCSRKHQFGDMDE